MRKVLVAGVGVLLLAGCSSPAKPELPRDEAAFLTFMEPVNIAGFSDEELIKAGDGACKDAAASGKSMADAGADLVAYSRDVKRADDATLAYMSTLYEAAWVGLCPNQD